MLQIRYTSFCSGRVKVDLAVGDDDGVVGPGAKGAKAIFIYFEREDIDPVSERRRGREETTDGGAGGDRG
jgi:hypothetical protein